jgi:molybdenum cofactor biosynthesis enzyme MoaA
MNTKPIAEEDLLVQYRAPQDLSNIVIDLEVTSVCDAVCGFCPREFMPDKKRFISMDLIERLADELRGNPQVLVILCGIGESMLHPELDKIVRTLYNAGAKVEMTTNGGRMNTQRFQELVIQGLTGFNFSLNAATAETHRQVMRMKNFDQIVQNIEEVLDVRDRLYPEILAHVSFVMCNVNEHEVPDFVQYWKPKTVRQIWLHPLNNRNGLLSPDVKKPTNVEKYAAMYANEERVVVDVFGEIDQPDNVCKIARQLVFLSVDGEMRLCAMDYKRVTSFGNLMHKSVLEMHRGKLSSYIRGEHNDFCVGCDFCPAGLRAQRISKHA